MSSGEPREQTLRQDQNVVTTLAQRRQPDRHHVQAEVEILAEFSRSNVRLEVAVRSGDQAGVDFDRGGAAHALECPFLEEAKKLRL